MIAIINIFEKCHTQWAIFRLLGKPHTCSQAHTAALSLSFLFMPTEQNVFSPVPGLSPEVSVIFFSEGALLPGGHEVFKSVNFFFQYFPPIFLCFFFANEVLSGSLVLSQGTMRYPAKCLHFFFFNFQFSPVLSPTSKEQKKKNL